MSSNIKRKNGSASSVTRKDLGLFFAFGIALLLLSGCLSPKAILEEGANGKTFNTVSPVSSPTPVLSNSDCVWEAVLPTIVEVQPVTLRAGDMVKVIGVGGHLKDNCGGYDESSRAFTLYFNHQSSGTINCYVNSCQTSFLIPQGLDAGTYCISGSSDGCDIQIEVIH